MNIPAARQKAERGSPGELPRSAHHHILCRPHTAGTLARALGVSVATVSRILIQLRRSLAEEGARLVSVKDGPVWRYEVRGGEESSWTADPFIRAVGFAAGGRRPRGESVDDALYGRPRRSR